MHRSSYLIGSAAGILLAAATAFAAAPAGMNMGSMEMNSSDPDSTNAYKGAMMKMHHAMDISYSGDADRDFVNGMIPHHQGAVDMAKVELKYGKDPELRALAQQIIAAQDKEIEFMEAWRKKHPAAN